MDILHSPKEPPQAFAFSSFGVFYLSPHSSGALLFFEDARAITASLLEFPCGSAGKESACDAGDLGLIPGLGRSPGEGKGYPLQYSGLENSMDCIVHGVAESDVTERLSLHFTFNAISTRISNLKVF